MYSLTMTSWYPEAEARSRGSHLENVHSVTRKIRERLEKILDRLILSLAMEVTTALLELCNTVQLWHLRRESMRCE